MSGNTEAYRLTQWEGTIRNRQASGLSVKAFCEKAGCHPNKYFYWQRKRRERASLEQNNGADEIAPTGWAEYKVSDTAIVEGELRENLIKMTCIYYAD